MDICEFSLFLHAFCLVTDAAQNSGLIGQQGVELVEAEANEEDAD
jgi:hypothetical protein